MKVLYSEGVFEELVQISHYLATENEETAHSFLDSCDATFRLLAKNKFAGFARKSHIQRLAEVRFFPVKDFPAFLIAYLPVEGGVRILHVIHGATDYRSRFQLD